MDQHNRDPEKRKAAPTTKSNAASQELPNALNFKRVIGATQAKPPTKYSLIWAARIAPAQRKLVLMALANYSNTDGTRIYPAVATVAANCGLGVNATRHHIHELTNSKLITVVKHSTQHWPTVYALNLQAISALPKCVALSKSSTPEVVSTECLSTPDLGHQHSSFSDSDLHESGAYPKHPDVSQGGAPSGSSASPPTLGVGCQELPKELDPCLFDLLVAKGKNTSGRVEALRERARELVSQGYDVNVLAKRSIERGWAGFPETPEKGNLPKRSRSAARRSSAKVKALHLGEGTDWEMPK